MSSPPSNKRKINIAIVTPEPTSVRRKPNSLIDTPKTGPYGTVMATTYAQCVIPIAGTVLKVKGKYFINSPIIPGQNIKGAKAASVVAVEAMIGQAMRFAACA